MKVVFKTKIGKKFKKKCNKKILIFFNIIKVQAI